MLKWLRKLLKPKVIGRLYLQPKEDPFSLGTPFDLGQSNHCDLHGKDAEIVAALARAYTGSKPGLPEPINSQITPKEEAVIRARIRGFLESK